MIEVLVSMLILMVGLLGLVGVMIQSQRAQLESYQRMQALLIAQDMAARINTNRVAADCYVQGSAMGTGNAATPDASGCAAGNANQKARATQDLVEWKALLLGSSEVSGGNSVGSILGARGCVTKDATSGLFQVSVAWQGIQAVGAPPAGITCGQGSYGADDAQRRAVSITVFPTTAS
jgi:type IV pilus assembly protein PilV